MDRPSASAFRRAGIQWTREWRGLCEKRFGFIDLGFALLLLASLLSIFHHAFPLH